MSETRYAHTLDGQEVQEEDLNGISLNAGLADDRTLADALRLAPFDGSTVAKAIVPYSPRVIPSANKDGRDYATVQVNGAHGSVRVMPFRAVLGTRVTVAQGIATGNGAIDNWRDIRSSVFCQSADGTTPGFVQPLTANGSGSPRWDLLYAAFAPDTASNTENRYVKPPAGGTPVSQPASMDISQAVSIGVVTGTPATNPTIPAIPADSGGTYYIPLAAVRVPNGFSTTSTVGVGDVHDMAPAQAPGVDTISAVDTCSNALSAASVQAWGTAGAHRPGWVMPSALPGGFRKLVAIDLLDASPANWSHATTGGGPYIGILDSSVDWRNRLFPIVRMLASTQDFVMVPTVGVSVGRFPGVPAGGGQVFADFFGSSMFEDGTTGSTLLCLGTPTNLPAMAASSLVTLSVDKTNGNLIFSASTTVPLCRFFVYIEATGIYPNAGTLA